MDSPGDADAARFSEAFEAGGDVDAVAVDLLAIDHHVAEVDADAELHPPLGWQIRVLGLERGLDLDGALDGIHDAGELGEYAVAGGIDEASVMLLDQRIDQLAMRGQSTKSGLLVLPHEAAIAEDIGTEYGGELAFQYPPIASRLSCRVPTAVKDCFKRHAVLRGGVVVRAPLPASDEENRYGLIPRWGVP